MEDIVDRLIDLHKQATTERSHYYVAKCASDAAQEIVRLRLLVQSLQPQARRKGAVVSSMPGLTDERPTPAAKVVRPR